MSNFPETESATATDPGLPVLPAVNMHLHQVMEPAVGVVVSSERCTASSKSASFVRHVSIDVSGSKLAGNFRPGQSFGIIPHASPDAPTPHKLRLYSIASPSRGEDGSGNIIATTVKRLIDEHWENHKLFTGVASNFLCDLQPGDKVSLTGPAGKRFILPAEPARHDYLFIATGTGIAPFRGMITDLFDGSPHNTPVSSRVTMLMGAAYRTDLIYHKALADRAAANSNFHYWTALSREHAVDGSRTTKPQYVQDRLAADPDQLRTMLDGGRTLIYICGIAGMELGIFQTMARTLPPETLRLYLDIDPAIAGDIGAWDRKMINRQIKPTKRVFLEVY
jgi:ferredoxin--NADP+ reductase